MTSAGTVLPSTQADWQAWFDERFPEQVNVRIQADNEDDEIDFITPQIAVIGVTANGLPHLLFWDSGSSKDFHLEPSAVTQSRAEPHVNVALIDHLGRRWLFWPRPAEELSEQMKATERGMAQTSGPDYLRAASS